MCCWTLNEIPKQKLLLCFCFMFKSGMEFLTFFCASFYYHYNHFFLLESRMDRDLKKDQDGNMAPGASVHVKTISGKAKQILRPLKDVPYQAHTTCGWRACGSSSWWEWRMGAPPWKNPRPTDWGPRCERPLCAPAKHSPWLIKAGDAALLAINGQR